MTYSNFEIYSSCRHNYIGGNRRLLQLPAAYSSFSSSPEPSPRPLRTIDKLFIIGVVTTVLGSLGWYAANGVQPCSRFISSSTSHLSNCCRCYNHCPCVPDEQEEKKFDAIASDEIVTKTFWTVVVVYALIFVRFIGRTAMAKYRSGSVHLLQVGILDKKQIFQRKLHIIAENADTSTFKGRIYLLKAFEKFNKVVYSFVSLYKTYEPVDKLKDKALGGDSGKVSGEGGKAAAERGGDASGDGGDAASKGGEISAKRGGDASGDGGDAASKGDRFQQKEQVAGERGEAAGGRGGAAFVFCDIMILLGE